MVVWDSKYFQTRITRLQLKLSRNKQQDVEKASKLPDTHDGHSVEDSERPQTSMAHECAKTGKNNIEVDHLELCSLELNDIIQYKVSTGLYVLGFFLITFTSIMAIRGVLHDLPRLFQFFSNVYLAGTIICGRNLSVHANP